MRRPMGLVVTLAALGLACDKSDGAAGGVPEREVLARVDGTPLTKADLARQLGDRTAFVRARYTAPDKRKELLDALVRFEVLAREAEARGYARDPDVVRQSKQQAVARLIAQELDKKIRPESIPGAELEALYRSRQSELMAEEAVRFDQILVADEAEARRLATLARALPARDAAGFRRLVAEHSRDDDSKARGGDSTLLERGSRDAPAPVVEAAFAASSKGMVSVGQIVGPVASERGHHILRLTQHRARALAPFAAVEARLRAWAVEARKRQAIDAWLAEARARVPVTVNEAELARVVPLPATAPGDAKPLVDEGKRP